MNRKSSTTLTISAVAFIAALLIDLYLILVYPSMIQVIIAVSLIVVVDTYFLVDGILAKVDEIANLNLDKQNELTKVEKGIYSVAKREEVSRTQKDVDNTDRVVSSTEKMAVLITKMATANARSSNETIEILNDICKELEQRNGKTEDENDYSHLRIMDKAE